MYLWRYNHQKGGQPSLTWENKAAEEEKKKGPGRVMGNVD